ncbi:hypothetical protein [Lysobacter gummosus]|uniref:hypothetical protein n=1 Tax=Lysobacter gummosus TaxID=262324 RepID=UPI00363DC4C6
MVTPLAAAARPPFGTTVAARAGRLDSPFLPGEAGRTDQDGRPRTTPCITGVPSTFLDAH